MTKKKKPSRKNIKKTQKVIFISKVVLFFFALILLMFTIYNFDLDFSDEVDMQVIVESEDYLVGPQCENKSFQDTAICLNDFARKNFYYNITDDNLNLNVQDMMEQGGDCKNWAEFYQKYMANYGFNNSQMVRLFVEKKENVSIYHVYLVVSHPTGYCNMDIKDLECYSYVNDDGETKE